MIQRKLLDLDILWSGGLKKWFWCIFDWKNFSAMIRDGYLLDHRMYPDSRYGIVTVWFGHYLIKDFKNNLRLGKNLLNKVI